jgi:hypothetical protein
MHAEIQPPVEGHGRAAGTTVSWPFGAELTATWTWILWTVGSGANVTAGDWDLTRKERRADLPEQKKSRVPIDRFSSLSLIVSTHRFSLP